MYIVTCTIWPTYIVIHLMMKWKSNFLQCWPLGSAWISISCYAPRYFLDVSNAHLSKWHSKRDKSFVSMQTIFVLLGASVSVIMISNITHCKLIKVILSSSAWQVSKIIFNRNLDCKILIAIWKRLLKQIECLRFIVYLYIWIISQ